jgi:HEAT repeat protein
MLRLSALAALSFAVTGCSLITVESTSGSKAMPVDLRSSADASRPPVGVPNVPTTQPGLGERANAVTVGTIRRITEFATAGQFREAAANLRSSDADVRRVALVRVADRSYGAGLPYTDVYRTTAQVDSDGLVRATAIRSINRVRDQQSGAVLVAALADGHPQVRLEACKALANLPTAEAEVPLQKLAEANDQPNDIRIAAIDALRHYSSLETDRVLVRQLDSSNFALAWQSRRSLFLQTNADYRYDQAAWLNYLTNR